MKQGETYSGEDLVEATLQAFRSGRKTDFGAFAKPFEADFISEMQNERALFRKMYQHFYGHNNDAKIRDYMISMGRVELAELERATVKLAGDDYYLESINIHKEGPKIVIYDTALMIDKACTNKHDVVRINDQGSLLFFEVQFAGLTRYVVRKFEAGEMIDHCFETKRRSTGVYSTIQYNSRGIHSYDVIFNNTSLEHIIAVGQTLKKRIGQGEFSHVPAQMSNEQMQAGVFAKIMKSKMQESENQIL